MVNELDLENRLIPVKMLKEAFTGTRELSNRILPEHTIPSLRIGSKLLEDALSDLIGSAREGLPIIGYHFSFPREFLSCFDCVPVCIEGVSFMFSAVTYFGAEKYYDKINNYGHPYHTCSAQKGVMGMSLDDLIQFDAIIAPTAPCDNTCASYPFFELRKKFPVVIVDMPFKHGEKSYNYFGEEIKRGLYELGAIIGQEPDFKKMKKFLEFENQITELQLEIFELVKTVPCPMENMFNVLSAGAKIFLAGTKYNLEFFTEMLELAKKRYKRGESYGGQERIRSIWPYMITFFDVSLLEWLNRELGMSVLFDCFNYSFAESIDTSNRDKMFYGMAKKSMEAPMVKQSSQMYYPFIQEMVSFVKEYQADCVIYTSSLACKQFGSVPYILKEAIKAETGVPMLLIELDVADARFTSLKKMKEKIIMFTKTLL
ncbi:MAG: hypothetical protein BAJALOKI1v1_710016 [Promethearchaeota archaeon]|nr:MAG: hypothetical protein BAJALOKI1v1_710016 [Candidatus Lokiarchaeota archaeon]